MFCSKESMLPKGLKSDGNQLLRAAMPEHIDMCTRSMLSVYHTFLQLLEQADWPRDCHFLAWQGIAGQLCPFAVSPCFLGNQFLACLVDRCGFRSCAYSSRLPCTLANELCVKQTPS